MAGRIDPRAQFPDACHDAGHLADDLRDTVEPAVDFLLPQRCSGSPDCSDTLILPRFASRRPSECATDGTLEC
jgi:hypothetical protein